MWLHVLRHLLATVVATSGPTTLVRDGSSPQLSIDARGTVRMIFGRQDTIFAVTSSDQGGSFGKPLVVGLVPDLHLGNTRGPVIASSRSRSLVAAVDKAGNIHLFQLDHAAGGWRQLPRTLNDAPGSAPEGLITLAADDADGFYAVWLDLRVDKRSQIFFSRIATTTSGTSWTPNVRVYTSLQGSACECCRPSIAVANGTVAIMFRNSINGFRDMYLTTSVDRGRTFSDARKLGGGTWKLDACPMDGGALGIGPSGQIGTVWRRESTLYYARPEETELAVGTGRSPMMSLGANATLLVWQDGERIKLKTLNGSDEAVVGDGRLPQVLALPDGRALAAWEKNGRVYVRKVE